MSRMWTVFLLACAVIGGVGGAALWGAAWVSTAMFVPIPFISVMLAGVWLLPAVVALRLVQRPLAGLTAGLVSGLVAFPYLFTELWWAFFAELPFLLLLYRFWTPAQHYAGALLVGILYPTLTAASFDLATASVWAQIAFFGLTLVSCLAGTWLGIALGDRLRAAGVARSAWGGRARSRTA